MTEMTKTVIFVAVAAVSILVAFFIRPSSNTFDVEELVGRKLNEFDIEKPKRMRIVKFDQKTASVHEFEVAEQDGLWVIPSKNDYPADAEQQMGKAAAAVTNLGVLRVATQSADLHEQLGVVSPSDPGLNAKSEGVGTRVVMSSSSGEKLADMIIGKAVKDTESQRYVRNSDQDIVYAVELDPEALSTNFEDWIEHDVLKINPFDIRHVQIKDYSAELMLTMAGPQVNWDRRGIYTLNYDNTTSEWKAESLEKFNPNGKEYVDSPLGDEEELSDEALQSLRDGLDDLVIVDVERKPEGMSADMKAGRDFLNNEAFVSLVKRGFAPVPLEPGGEPEILSTEGELTCTLQNGVEYVLRFGNLTTGSSADSSADATDNGESEVEEEEAKKDQIQRYLFVMTRFNPDVIEKPALEDPPELPEGSEAETNPEAETEAAVDEAADDEADNTAEATEDAETEASDDAEKAGDESADESKDAEEDAQQSTDLQKLIAERKRIEEANNRLLEEYKQKVEAGEKRVRELNERFSDWYYVISNDIYNKIHLSRDQIVRPKAAPAEEAAPANGTANPLRGLPNLPEMGNAQPAGDAE